MSSRVITVRLIGGLGNQLFQLQHALNLQKKHGGLLQVDDSFLAASSKAHETLAIGQLISDLPAVRLGWFDLKLKRTLERLLFKAGLPVPLWLKPIYLFENANADVSRMDRIIVDGFWQRAANLNEEFVEGLRQELQTRHTDLAEDNRVCVHVRRGDYLTNRHWFIKQQEVTPLAYYETAFAYFREKLRSPRFEVYTDDEQWAAETFGQMADVVVMPSGALKPFDLLAKMASYRNYVIANSTLSWWAAVASWGGHKQVILPKSWGKGTSSDQYRCDLT